MQIDKTKLYKTPFSREYWHQAMNDFRNVRMLVFAALMVAIRIALKPIGIPIAADLRINISFFINAYGSMVYGPVIAILGAVISDTLGYLIYPNGVYFFPFILTEIAGSLIFALFLYRAEISATRIILCRFCVNFFVNIIMTTPIMALYYTMIMGKNYVLFDIMRIVKNLSLFPVESILLIIFFRLVIPPTQKMGYIYSGTEKLRFTKKTIIILGVLLIFSIALITGYAIYSYNSTSFSASYSAQERLERNTEMTEWVRTETGSPDDKDLVVIIESARSKVGVREMTYELSVYSLDREKLAENPELTEESIRGFSKSKAANAACLVRKGSATAVTDKKSGEHLSMTVKMD
jgi:ECF transporter S component (folate family)